MNERYEHEQKTGAFRVRGDASWPESVLARRGGTARVMVTTGELGHSLTLALDVEEAHALGRTLQEEAEEMLAWAAANLPTEDPDKSGEDGQ